MPEATMRYRTAPVESSREMDQQKVHELDPRQAGLTKSVTDDAKDSGANYEHEDNRVEPSKSYHKFLKGRTLSAHSTQPFQNAWIYQRFINITMQFFVRFTEKKRAWYWTDVEGGRIEHRVHPGIVVFAYSLLSPLFFPVVYGLAVLVLVPFGFLSIPYIYKVKISGGGEGTTRWSDILITIWKSTWYFISSLFPWFYVFWPKSTLACAIDIHCGDVQLHIAPILVYSSFSASILAGFRYAREISASACDGACDRQKKIILNHPRYGSALNKIVTKMSNKNDRLSYYPVFVMKEEDELDLRLPWTTEAALIACAALHALLPVSWMSVWHHQNHFSAEDLSADKMTAAMIFMGTVAPFIEIRKLLQHFLRSLEEFQQCVDQLLIVQYIASSRSGKERTTLKRSFLEAVSRNDNYRIQHHKKDNQYVALLDGESRFDEMDGGHDDPTRSESILAINFENSRPVEGGRTESDVSQSKDELEYLKVFQVAFNFRRVEGIFLFRSMRKYLAIDILNERLEVEQFANLSILLVFAAMISMLALYLEAAGAGCCWLMIPYDITVLFVFLMRTLNLCVEANVYLFEENDILLLTWMDHCTEWNFPESEFEKNRAPAIAWIWDSDVEQTMDVKLDADILKKTNELDKTYADDVYKALDSMLKSCQMLETRQQILGFAITKQLRARLVAPFGTFVAVYMAKVGPSLLAQWRANHVLERVQEVHDSSDLKNLISS